MRNLIILFLLSLSINQCSLINPCDGIACTSPPPDYYIKLIDKDTGENLYANNTLKPENILLVDQNGKRFLHEYINEYDMHLINISIIGWNTGSHHYTLTVAENNNISIDLDIENVNEDCCNFFRVNKFNIKNHQFDENNRIITIKL